MNRLPFELEQQNIVVKREAITSVDYGFDPTNRDVDYLLKHGLINLDKPKGPTSHQVADYAKRILRLKKAGGFKSIVPSEGVVFNYKGKTYKLTGTFAPINQILGSLKYA